jgi:hypothetical protein
VLASSNSSFVIETHGGGGAFSLGASNIGNTLGDTGVTGTRLVLAGIGRVTLSQSTDAAGGTISISGGTAGAGAFSGGVSDIGNTLGTTGITGTQVVFAGGNNITLSQSLDGDGGTVTISGPNTVAQSVQTQNRFNLTLDGNTAGVLAEVSSGTLTLAGGNGVTLSQAGNAITISGNTFSQSVQPETQTFIGGISASDALYTSGTVRMTGAGNITVVSGTGQRVIISGSQSVQPETQTFVGGVIASNTTYTSGSVRFTGVGGGVTVSSNTGQRVDISVAAQSVQTQNLIAMTLSGNTSGAQALISSGTMTLAGGNNITVSQNGNAVTISGPNVGGAQTGISGIIGSDATYTSGTVQFTGSNMVTVKSSAGQRVVIDATQSVQPGIQNLVASDATFSSGTVSISGFGAATVNTAANLIRISVPTQSVQPETQTFIGGISASDTLYTSGTVRITGVGGGITVSSNTGQRIDLSVAAQSVQPGVQQLVVSNTTFSSGTVSISGFGDVTVNTAANIIRISAPAQTGTQFSAGISGGNTVGDTGTVAGRVVFAGGQSITLSGSTNGASETISIVGASTSQSVQTQGIVSLGVSTGGNTAGNTGVATGSRLVIVGSGMVTASQGTAAGASTITLNATQSVQSQGILSAGISGGNTAGQTGANTGSRLVFAGGANITLSGATAAGASTISIVGGAGGAGGSFSAGVSTGGNTAGATGITGTQLVLVGTNAISLSQTTGANGGTVSIDAPATSSLVGASGISISTNGSTISVYQPNRSKFYPFNDIPIVTGQQGQATLHIAPLHFPNVQHDRVALGLQISNATNSSNSITISAWVGLYTQNASSISLISSTSGSTNFTGSGTVGAYSSYGGPRLFTIPWTNTITENDYFFGIVIRTTTGGGAGHTVSQLCVSKFTNSNWSGILGAAAGATDQYQLGLGVYSVSTSGIPASIAFTQINGSGSMALREPIFQLVSGTV